MKFLKKILCYLTIAAVAITSNLSLNVQTTKASNYNLASNIQDGVILHCFDWKYTDIIAELPNIAAAGFTAVQTSPAQMPCGSGSWYWLYQPLGFSVQSNGLGSSSDLKNLCTEAHKYGIKVIVDVVSNHLAGSHDNIQSDLKASEYWHNTSYNSSNIDWNNRYQVTYGDIGMADLNTENSYVQTTVKKYVQELKGLGVDGIRWDAAKHIALPSEGSSYWSTVIDSSMYNYGEILTGPDDSGKTTANIALMKEYTTYMTVTDSNYGNSVLQSIGNNTVPSDYANWGYCGIANNKMLYWAESHDTWPTGNNGFCSNGYSQNQVDRAYAIVASRNGATALYFSRPSTSDTNAITIGVKGSTHFTSTEVAAVNHFHNAVIGESEYYVHEESNSAGAACAVCRESGAVVVLGSGSNKKVTIANGGGTTAPGTYYDEITGNEWVVTSTTMTGTVGSSGIAVFYKSSSSSSEVSTTAAVTEAATTKASSTKQTTAASTKTTTAASTKTTTAASSTKTTATDKQSTTKSGETVDEQEADITEDEETTAEVDTDEDSTDEKGTSSKKETTSSSKKNSEETTATDSNEESYVTDSENTSSPTKEKKSNTGLVIGIVIAGVGIAFGGVYFFFIRRKK